MLNTDNINTTIGFGNSTGDIAGNCMADKNYRLGINNAMIKCVTIFRTGQKIITD